MKPLLLFLNKMCSNLFLVLHFSFDRLDLWKGFIYTYLYMYVVYICIHCIYKYILLNLLIFLSLQKTCGFWKEVLFNRTPLSNCFWTGSFWIWIYYFSLFEIWNLEVCLTWIILEVFKALKSCFQELKSFIFTFVLFRC